MRIKLTSYRDIDRAHVRDLLSLNLVDERVIKSLPAELLVRLREIESTE